MMPPASTIRRRRAFTLLEVVVSASVISVLMLGMTSAMVIAGKAVTKTASDVSSGAAVQTVQTLASELRNATAVTEMSTNAIAITVPDRNGDGSSETIRYAWSGTAGAPLTRQYNGGTAATVLNSVQSLSFVFNKNVTVVPVLTESAEQTVWSYNNTLLPNSSYGVKKTGYVCEVFSPVGLPANTNSWKVTRVQYMATRAAAGSINVELRTAAAGVPSATVTDSVSVPNGSLPVTASWMSTAFTNGGGLSPAQQMCIAFSSSATTAPGNISYQTIATALLNGTQMTSADQGSTWSTSLLSAVNLYVYGTYTAPVNTNQYNLTSVDITLRAGSGTNAASPTVAASAMILNRPQVTGP